MNKNLVISIMFLFLLFGCITNEESVIDGNIEENQLEEVSQKYAHNLFLDGKVSLCKVFSNDELSEVLDLKSNKIYHERIRLDLEEVVTTSCTYFSLDGEKIKISYASKGFSQEDIEKMVGDVEKGEIEGYEYIYDFVETFSTQSMRIYSGENIITLTVQNVEFNKENMIDLAKLFLSKVDLNKVESHKLQESSKTLSKYKGKHFTFDYPSNWEHNLHYYENVDDKVALEDPDGMILFLVGTSDYGLPVIDLSTEDFKVYAENLAKQSNANLLYYDIKNDYYTLIFEQGDIVSIYTLYQTNKGGYYETER